jgi:hypothetical protein
MAYEQLSLSDSSKYLIIRNWKRRDKRAKKEGGERERRERKENKIKRLKVKCLINDIIYGNICIYGRVVEMIYNKQVMLLK